MIHLMKIKTEGLILFHVFLNIGTSRNQQQIFSSLRYKILDFIKISLMFHHLMILCLNLLPLCFHLIKRRVEKRKPGALVIALVLSVPIALIF